MSGTVVSLDEVNKTVDAANQGFKQVKLGMERMDANILADMRVLFDKQLDILEAIDKLGGRLEDMPVKSSGKGKSLLFWGGVALVGYAVYKATEPKKGPQNG